MKLDKHQVAEVLSEMAAIFELKGENPFKIRAYQNAARIVEGLDELSALIKSGALTDIKGIGSHLADHIRELSQTGRLKEYEALRRSVPEGIFEMLRIQGLGPKKVKALWEKLGIVTVAELEYACRGNRLVDLDGFGERTQEKILKGIEYLRRFEDKHLFSEAYAAALEILRPVAKHKAAIRSEIGGSIRRRKELIRDIDILAASDRPKQLIDLFVSLPQVDSVTAKGETKGSVVLRSGIAADLRVVSDKEFPFALHYFTGSKEHNVAMRSLAKKDGIKMNEYGLFRGTKFIACKDEAEIFEKLGLDYIPPELRENQGEIEAAAEHKLPRLVEMDDIRGVFHVHSEYSDGTATIEEMALAAKRFQYEYIGMADHSQSAAYAGGLKPDDVKKQHKEIDRLNAKLKGITILKGIESDILPDGSLDYPDSILSMFDFVIISIHSRFNMSESEMTKRIIKGIRNRYASIVGHPTGRLLLAREGYNVDMHAVIDAAAGEGVAIEINAHPQRLDLDWRYGKYARSKGLKITIGPDAHGPEGIHDMTYGVGIARKGWFERRDILNCLDAEEVTKYFKSRK